MPADLGECVSVRTSVNHLPPCLHQDCAARGEDYDRVKLLEISAEDAERWERKKKKRNPDPGFSGEAGHPLAEWDGLFSLCATLAA